MQEVVPVKKKIRYRTVPVQSVNAVALTSKVGLERCIVAVDVAKETMVAGFADSGGVCQMLVRFSHPSQTLEFVDLVVGMRELGVKMEIAMEPTGVYGDALRYQFTKRGFPVFRVDPSRAHAMAEVLDGVPSLHDAKACTLIADLHARGISSAWREKTELEQDMRALMDERDLSAEPFQRCVGQLEAVMSRHFPELAPLIDHSCAWHLHLLAAYPSPARITASSNEVRGQLQKVSRGGLSVEKIEQVLVRAHSSLGAPVSATEAVLISRLASFMLELRTQVHAVDRRIHERLARQPELQQMVATFGATTTAAIVADLGDPSTYESSASFEKALGLNLKEKSSGQSSNDAPLHITKRGPARPRRYLYMAALRAINHDAIVCAWYQRRKAFIAGFKIKAVVAVMRKLARAIVHVARGNPFDASKLFDVRRLEIATSSHEQTSSAPST